MALSHPSLRLIVALFFLSFLAVCAYLIGTDTFYLLPTSDHDSIIISLTPSRSWSTFAATLPPGRGRNERGRSELEGNRYLMRRAEGRAEFDWPVTRDLVVL